MRKLTEYSASWVKIPARIAGMPQAVWNRPVTRQHTGQRGCHKGDAHRHAVEHQHHADCAARAEGAVNGQIGHIQNAVGNVHADGHDAPDEALCHSAGHGVYQRGQEIHKNILIS